MAAAHRLLHCNQPTKLILRAEDVQSTAQTWRSCCVHSTFCVHSTAQAWACLGQRPCGALTPLGAVGSWSGSQHVYAFIPGLHLHMKSCFCPPNWTGAQYSNLHALKTVHVHCKHSSEHVSVYQAALCRKSDRFIITEFIATKRLCKYIFASVIFVPAAQILVILAFEFVLFCHTMSLGIIWINNPWARKQTKIKGTKSVALLKRD